jgi:hypothetical protein
MVRKGVVIGISVAAITAVGLVTAAVLIALSFRSIGEGFIGLRYKTSKPTVLAETKTYTHGMQWAGLGYSFYLYPVRYVSFPARLFFFEFFSSCWVPFPFRFIAERLF